MLVVVLLLFYAKHALASSPLPYAMVRAYCMPDGTSLLYVLDALYRVY
jgi:hypothetical protein